MQNVIRFYGKMLNPEYFPFSNFYHAPFRDLSGNLWPTTEHYFQAMKFLPEAEDSNGNKIRKIIRYADTPKIAAGLGRNRAFPLRDDWNNEVPGLEGIGVLVKDAYMYRALTYKFTQHEYLKDLLIGTKDAEIIEASPIDYYWGEGKDGSGKNMLGKLLMQIREDLISGKGINNYTRI